jgi:ribosomal protein S4
MRLMRKVYLLTEKRPMKIYRRKYKNLYSLHLTYLFYINLRHRHFQKIAKKAKKMDGFFEENYLLLLEGRLVSVVYRSAMILNLFDSINFVKNNNVTVNGFFVSYINYIVPIMKIIGFRIVYKGVLF